QMLLEMGNRTVVVSGGASWANDSDKPSRPAAPADETAVRNRRRLCVMCMRTSLESSARAIEPSSSLQLALELIENPPVGALRDEGWRAGLDHARLAQPQGVKADRIIGIVVAPACVGNLLHRLKRIVVLIALRRHQAGGLLGLGSAKVRCLGDGAHGTLRSHWMPADKLPVAGNDAAQVLRPGAIQ